MTPAPDIAPAPLRARDRAQARRVLRNRLGPSRGCRRLPGRAAQARRRATPLPGRWPGFWRGGKSAPCAPCRGSRAARCSVRADAPGCCAAGPRGTPLQLARPRRPAWYRDARASARDAPRRRHPQRHRQAAELADDARGPRRGDRLPARLHHRRRGRLFRLMAREDLRHLLKQKRAYAPHLLTPAERRMLARKALPRGSGWPPARSSTTSSRGG